MYNMNNTQYIVVETRAEHEFRVFAEEYPEVALGLMGVLFVVFVIGFINSFFFKNKTRKW